MPREESESFRTLNRDLQKYLDTLNQVFGWTSTDKRAKGDAFVQHEVLPGRMALLSLTARVAQSNARRMEANSRQTSDMLSQFRLKLLILVAFTLGLGLLLAGISLWRILQLEKETETRYDEIARGKRELHDLSAKLLAAHEDERRNIARELHDEVGQALWAVSLGLDNLGAALTRGDTEQALRRLEEVRDMSNQNIRTIRNMSLLLRPSMLDDLGLIPALKWLAREVSRTTGLTVDVAADDPPAELPEDHKTCLFRVVQEALRNISRHARASYAQIRVETANDRLLLSVQDDGAGFDPVREKGLGLLGMEERVSSLGGVFRIASQSGRGTTVSLELPFRPVSTARASGD